MRLQVTSLRSLNDTFEFHFYLVFTRFSCLQQLWITNEVGKRTKMWSLLRCVHATLRVSDTIHKYLITLRLKTHSKVKSRYVSYSYISCSCMICITNFWLHFENTFRVTFNFDKFLELCKSKKLQHCFWYPFRFHFIGKYELIGIKRKIIN